MSIYFKLTRTCYCFLRISVSLVIVQSNFLLFYYKNSYCFALITRKPEIKDRN